MRKIMLGNSSKAWTDLFPQANVDLERNLKGLGNALNNQVNEHLFTKKPHFYIREICNLERFTSGSGHLLNSLQQNSNRVQNVCWHAPCKCFNEFIIMPVR